MMLTIAIGEGILRLSSIWLFRLTALLEEHLALRDKTVPALAPLSFSLRTFFCYIVDGRNDLIWSNPWPHPRWGQGAFRIALEALYTSLTNDPEPMNITQFGKPTSATFTYAENILMNYLDQWHGVQHLKGDGTRAAPRRVYMFGDSPDSDIRGANEFG